MAKYIRIIIFFSLISSTPNILAEVFQQIKTMESNLYCITINPKNNNLIFLGSNNAIFKSIDGGENWQKVYVVKGETPTINRIYISYKNENLIYVTSNSGLYVSNDCGINFKKIFGKKGGKVFSLIEKDKTLYIGTDTGLYSCQEPIYSWKKILNFPENANVFWIITNSQQLIASNFGVYKTENFKNFERTFIVNRPQTRNTNQTEEEEYHYSTPLTLYYDNFDKKIYLGTNRGIYYSIDKGNSWQKLSIPAINRLEIRKIIQDKKLPYLLYLATNHGLFKIDLEKIYSKQIYGGITSNDIRDIAIDKKDNLFVVTNKGLFSNLPIKKQYFAKNYQELFKNEPTINEIRKTVLKYNEIDPKKIANWRKSLKYRALFPTISLNYDKTIYGTAGGATYNGKSYVGPYDWGLTFSWDLGNLIWNNYEDDIDTRSRLNTQLRTDILDEVTRLYFERKRLKLQLLKNPNMDEEKNIEKQLRLEELTAALDEYTGGYFSKRLKELQNKK
jgi:hypothetical protein